MTTTPYVSKGAEEVPAQFTNELGSSLSLQIREMVPALFNRVQALRQYDYMNRTDAVVSVSLRAGKTPIQSADFYIDPIGEDAQAETVADFVNYNMFENLTSPWQYVLNRILKMYQHGGSIIEPVYTTGLWAPNKKMANRKTYNMLKKLAYRPGSTITRLEYNDSGGPKTVLQTALRGSGKSEEVEIPIEKAIIFSIGDSDDYLGESLLRTAYPHWYYKTHLYKVDAIQKERHGMGVPMGKLPPGFREADKLAMNELLSNLRTNEKAYITLPPGYEVEFAEIHTNLVDVLGSASHHDILIMLNVFAEFMMLGLSAGGGRATSGAQTDLFYKSVWYIAEAVCDFFNMFLIPKLVRYNFDTDIMPQMKVRNIGQARDMQQSAAALANLFNARNGILTPDINTEQYIRKLFDIPLKKSSVQTPIVPASPSPNGGGSAPTADISAQGGQGNTTKGPTQA